MSVPALSVVIPTHNRRVKLLGSLDLIVRQIIEIPDTEIIVAADCCDDGTEAAVEEWAAGGGFNIRVVSHRAHNPAATRNLGARCARGQTLLFLDDDIEPLPGLLRAHLDAREEGMAVMGFSRPVFSVPLSLWQKEARMWWTDAYSKMANPGYRLTYRDFFSLNFSIPRSLFDLAGGFDETLDRLEDYEFGLRLLKVGGRYRYLRQAAALHLEATTLTKWLNRIRMEGEADVSMAEANPALRAQFWWLSTPARGLMKGTLWRLAFRNPRRGDFLVRCLVVTAESAARCGMRATARRMVTVARDYQYLRGLASTKTLRDFNAWIQDGPPPAVVECTAPLFDVASVPADIDRVLALGSERGLRVLRSGVVLGAMPPVGGAEPLRLEHVHAWAANTAPNGFFPEFIVKKAQLGAKKTRYA